MGGGRAQDGGLVARVDALANQVDLRVRPPHPPSGLAVTRDGRTAWVATAGDRAIRRVAARAGRVAERVEFSHAPDQVAFGADAVWVTSSKDDAVMRVDAASDEVREIPVGNGPTGIAFGEDRVWVANSRDGTVSRIDPETSDVGTVHLGFRPAAVAVEQGAVWVALAG
jgi:DNA-binding beta-propeller fold protein YncE